MSMESSRKTGQACDLAVKPDPTSQCASTARGVLTEKAKSPQYNATGFRV